MTTTLDLAPRPSSPPTDDMGLTALLELLAADGTGTPPARRSLRESATALVGWLQDVSRRAARWGSVAEVAQ